MELNDFLKCKKARCVKAYGDCLTVGKEYSVLNIRMEVEVRDDEGGKYYWESDHFEPVVDDELPKSAENPLQKMELTPKFKVGDKVYYRGDEEIYVVSDVSDLGDVQIKYWREDYYHNSKYFCHATQENYERLQAAFPDIEFEQPPKPLVENDLCIAMLKGKHTNIMCQVDSDKTNIRIITLYTGDFFYDRSGNRYSQVIPVDTTGEPLTESVLDE